MSNKTRMVEQADQAIERLRQQVLKSRPQDIDETTRLEIRPLYHRVKELMALVDFASRAKV